MQWRASGLCVWCGIRRAAFSSKILIWGSHGTREQLASEPSPQVAHASSPPDAHQTLPVCRTRLTEESSQQRSNYWVDELHCDYENTFLCHGKQRKGASATECEGWASIGYIRAWGLLFPKQEDDAILTEQHVRKASLLYICSTNILPSQPSGRENQYIKGGWSSEYMGSYQAHIYKLR